MSETTKKPVKIRKTKRKVVKRTCDELKAANISPDIGNEEFQELLKCVSSENTRDFEEGKAQPFTYLYPQKDDPSFNVKLAQKKEFYDTRYEEKTRFDFDNIKEVSQRLCDNTEFELEPHQMFVRNFMSFQTPYNSLLLYHGLGTGKTCSAISVAEEMRTYLNQLGITKRIIIVASPAVQKNFRIQMFDESKLKEVDGLWNIKACVGNKFVKEINPMNMRGLSRDRVIRQIKKIINQSYRFQGYSMFSNYIGRIIDKNVRDGDSDEVRERKQRRSLQKEFSGRMIVIDEVHNIRISDDGNVKQSSENLLKLVSYADNIKLLLLSATPMFNSYKEVIWLLNLMNLNDKRFPISESEVFDKNGNFKVDKKGNEVGKDLLIQKSVGYISYVRGENPFTFPYRIWPKVARNPNSLFMLQKDGIWDYPDIQINGGAIVEPIQLLDLTITDIGTYQGMAYDIIVDFLKERHESLSDPRKGLPYPVLDAPLQALNMIYPHAGLNEDEGSNDAIVPLLYGGKGLEQVMIYDGLKKTGFRYRDATLTNFGRIFSLDNIGEYSGKIKYICERVKKSAGIVFIYSQFIDGGVVPLALTLEEMGITRYGSKTSSLFKTDAEHPIPQIDALTLKEREEGKPFHPAKYTMITGDRSLTPDVEYALKAVTDPTNAKGEKVKVVIVSRAGSEGLDFKNIRQMHILDPWYNLNRQEQIIGRGVRNLSHCSLPYEERNVEIYLYGTRLAETHVEAVDLYVYRLAERKARKIGRVSRVLKENAVDCLLNRKGLDFTEAIVDKTVQQRLSTGNIIEYSIGDRENSAICDFSTCNYKCNGAGIPIDGTNQDTYNETFIVMNLDKILQRVRLLFKERYIYRRHELMAGITALKRYPQDQIYTALTSLINDKNEYITDVLGRLGHLVNVGEYYMFQPLELSNEHISRFERVHPIDFKRPVLTFNLPDHVIGKVAGDEADATKELSTKQLITSLKVTLETLLNPAVIGSEAKEDWAAAAAWAISSLVKYNGVDKSDLVFMAMSHILDSLPYNEKQALLSSVYFKEDLDELEKMIKRFFEQFVITGGGATGIVISDFRQSASDKEPYRVLILEGDKWVGGREARKAVKWWARALTEKFIVRNLEEINEVLGFMTHFKGTHIVFKTKRISLSVAGRASKGQRCDRGESKKVLTERINGILGPRNGKKKYILDKSTITEIYGRKGREITQVPEGNPRGDVKVNTLQLCAEAELLFRYFDQTRRNGLRWFFSSVAASINGIETLGR